MFECVCVCVRVFQNLTLHDLHILSSSLVLLVFFLHFLEFFLYSNWINRCDNLTIEYYKCECFLFILKISSLSIHLNQNAIGKMSLKCCSQFYYAIQFRFQIKFLCEYNDFQWNTFILLILVLCVRVACVNSMLILKEFTAPHIQLSELFVKLFSAICLFAYMCVLARIFSFVFFVCCVIFDGGSVKYIYIFFLT